MTVLCLASYEKGHEFLRECKRQGCRVLLLTSLSLKEESHWPRESIDDIFYMPDQNRQWDRAATLRAVSFLARSQWIDRIVPLDDFDLEMAAALREHLRVPGMGETTTRYFRDKLAMRMQALDQGLHVPDFVHVLHHGRVCDFLQRVPPPWVLKPRFLAGAIGIRKLDSREEFWRLAEALGDEQPNFLLERFVPGDICHVDSIVYERRILFQVASRYGTPPLAVSTEGGVFTTRLLEPDSAVAEALLHKNQRVLEAMGLVRGVSHTEFILGRDDGRLYFLETSARVGGAHIADLVEAGTGVNLWAEWAKVEVAGGTAPYQVTPQRQESAGLLIALARQEWPDTSAYDDPEIVWRMSKRHHVGFLVRSREPARVSELMERYASRVREDFLATAPPPERPVE